MSWRALQLLPYQYFALVGNTPCLAAIAFISTSVITLFFKLYGDEPQERGTNRTTGKRNPIFLHIIWMTFGILYNGCNGDKEHSANYAQWIGCSDSNGKGFGMK
eukprot:135247_1